MISNSWHSYPSIYNLGHVAIKELFTVPVSVEEKIDGCVTLDTPILMEDLSYRPAGLLQCGDKLIGFTDTLNDPRLTSSIVTVASPIKKHCVVVSTNQGSISVSEDHPFLIRQLTNNNGKRWVMAKNLLPGMAIVPSGVLAVNRAQEHGCTYCYAGG